VTVLESSLEAVAPQVLAPTFAAQRM